MLPRPLRRDYGSDPVTTRARWFKNGDHPNDMVGFQVDDPQNPPYGAYERVEGAVVRFYRTPPHVPGFRYDTPETPGDQLHEQCGRTWHEHGWLDNGGPGETVCPGDWVVGD